MLLAVPLLVALGATGSEATKIPFAAKYDAAFAEARARNVPVLICDFDGWTTDRQQTQPSAFYSDREFLAQLEFAVILLAGQEDHGTRKESVDGEEREVCQLFGGVPCDAHRDTLPKLFADFGKDGQLVSPLFVVASPDRKELERFEHEKRPVDLVIALKDAAKRIGPGMPRSQFRQVTTGLASLKRLIELHEFAAATAALDPLKKVPGTFAPNAEVKAAEIALDQAGREQLKRGRELYEASRRLEGMVALDDVKASFGKLACAADAAALLAGLEKDPANKELLPELKSHRTARALYQGAVQQEQAGDKKRAIETLDKLLKQFPDSAFTDRARALRDGLRSG